MEAGPGDALRYLSHAATCLTRWKTLTQLGGQPSNGQGFDISANTTGSPAITLTHDMIVYYHERCTNLIMRYSASFPYDWGAARNMNRYQMMDFPLIEFDLFQPPLSGKLFANSPRESTIDAAQWKPIPARPISNVGVSYQYPVNTLPYDALYAGGLPTETIPDASAFGSSAYQKFWGEQNRSTLTKPFQAAERCRQIVFWAVDWQAYEDVETAAGAPVDAGKYPICAPRMNMDFARRMSQMDWPDTYLFTYRNPEKVLSFNRDISSLPSGTDTSNMMVNATTADRGTSVMARECFSGLYGADRNFNKKLDRGSVPKSVRMRAVTVARFNFYDPRLPLTIR